VLFKKECLFLYFGPRVD